MKRVGEERDEPEMGSGAEGQEPLGSGTGKSLSVLSLWGSLDKLGLPCLGGTSTKANSAPGASG